MVKPTLKSRLIKRMRSHFAGRPAAEADAPLARAQSLLAAIDAGGVPLSPAIVNDIARRLGLEVSAQASMDETIPRIRAAVAARLAPPPS